MQQKTNWLVYNIAKDVRRIERSGLAAGARQVTNDFATQRYGGPCSPWGTDRYCFKLYALATDSPENVAKP